jgi:hypothetical protein
MNYQLALAVPYVLPPWPVHQYVPITRRVGDRPGDRHTGGHPHHAFVRTPNRAGKAKRLRHNPAVTIAPSTWLGKATAPPFARARLLSGDEAQHAARLLARKYPFLQGV